MARERGREGFFEVKLPYSGFAVALAEALTSWLNGFYVVHPHATVTVKFSGPAKLDLSRVWRETNPGVPLEVFKAMVKAVLTANGVPFKLEGNYLVIKGEAKGGRERLRG